jgi:phosphoesterase RecJ-like protein
MNRAQPWDAAVDLIHRSTNPLLICHVSPDGDAIGSLLGLGLALRTLDKTPILACESPVPPKFSFLPGYQIIINTVNLDAVDLVIGLDCSDTARLGSIFDVDLLSEVPLINIDHHITNLYFGDVNLVDPDACSTAEIIFTLLDHLGVPLGPQQTTRLNELPAPSDIDHTGASESAPSWPFATQAAEIATCLLTGIVTDTLGFRTSNVTPKVMGVTMQLMQAGASLSEVTHNAFNKRPLCELKLLAQGLSRMQSKDGVAWSEIALTDRQVCGDRGNGDAGLVGMLVRTQEIHMTAVFIEKKDNQVEISFRADPGFDVAQLALSLGGGGHAAASGCTVSGPLEAAKARVLPMLLSALREQRRE